MRHFLVNIFSASLIAILLIATPFSVASAVAGVPTVISYQGRLTDANGILLGGTSGTNYYFKFSIWDSATVGGGTRLWPASAPGTISLPVTEGVFNVNIGDTGTGYPDALTYNFQDNDTVYLQVEVSTNGSSFETPGPRQRITSSGTAINAKTLGGNLPSYFLDANNLTNFQTPFNTALAGVTADAVAEGTLNKYFTSTLFDSSFATKTSDNLTEGATNKYFTASNFNTSFATKSTTDLTEGSNLYYTDVRARAALSATGPITYDNITGVIGIGTASSTTDGALTATDWNTFNTKQNAITTGTSAQYLRGDLSLGTFPTALSAFTNDQGFLTSVSNGDVLAAIGYTPYDASNPAGYITSGSLSGYVPTSRTINGYDLTGDVIITTSDLGIGNVENTALSTWAGSTNITTLGTISTGTWQGTAIADGYIASASTWNAKEDTLTFSTGLTRTSNTITNDLSTGISGGQTVYGGTGSGDNLVLRSTTNATRGNVKIDTTSGGFNFRDYLGSIPAIYPGSNVTAGSDGFILASFGTTSMFYGSGGAASLYHYVSGGNRTLLTSSYYNIGVNTSIGLTLGTTPSAKLHLESGTTELQTMGASILLNQRYLGVNSVGLRIYQTPDAGNQETGRMYMRLTNGSSATLGIRMEFSTLQRSTMVLTPRMVIDNLGQVGIGTTSGVDATSKLEVRTDALGVTQTTSSGLALTNTTAAAAGAQQISPALRWSGKGWATTGSTSQAVDFRSYVLPTQGAAQPTGELMFESAINGGSYQRSVSIVDPTAAAGGDSFRVYGNGTQGAMRIYAGQASSFNQLGIGVTVGATTLDGVSNTISLATNSAARLTVVPTTGFVVIAANAVTPSSRLEVRTLSLGTTQTTDSGLALTNTTAAALGAQQISPALRFSGNGWKTAATAASQAVDFRNYLTPAQGVNNPTGILKWDYSVNGGAYADVFTITPSSGRVTVLNGIYAMSLVGGATGSIATEGSQNISISPNNTAVLTAAVGGNVGIGQTVPTSKLDVTTNSLGVTQTTSSGLALVNTTAATAGAQQISPALRWSGKGWATTGSTSQAVDFRNYLLPVQGTTAPSGTLVWDAAVNGGSYINQMELATPTTGTTLKINTLASTGGGVLINGTNYQLGLGLSGYGGGAINGYTNSGASAGVVQIASNGGSIIMSGSGGAGSWGVNGIATRVLASTYTDYSASASSTVTNNMVNTFGAPTLAASSASVTFTNAATVYIAGAPAAGTNTTLTNPYALMVASGNTSLGGNLLLGAGATSFSSSANFLTIGNTRGLAYGTGASTGGNVWSIAMGANATTTGSQDGAIAIGVNTSNSGRNVAIGNYSVAEANEFVSGAYLIPVTDVYFGSGKVNKIGGGGAQGSQAGTSYTINGSGAFGTDFAGGDIGIAGGKATGAGSGGSIIFSTSTVGSSGTTLQTLSEKMRIAGTTGFVGISNIAPGYLLHVGSSSTVSGTTVARFENAGGTCDVTPNLVSGVVCTSDERFKENISTYEGSLAQVLALRPVSYALISDPTHESQIGFLAQELEQVLPGLVRTDAKGNKAVLYAGLTPILVGAIKDMDIRVKALELGTTSNGLGEYASLFFTDVMEKVEDGIAYVRSMVVGTLKVGTPEKRTGITLYDEETGDPYCLSIANGQTKTIEGECGIYEPEPETPSVPEPDPQPEVPSDTPLDTEENPPVIEEPSVPEETPAPSPEPETPPEPEVQPDPQPEASVTP